jgi:SAM-dependent methyltransferase
VDSAAHALVSLTVNSPDLLERISAYRSREGGLKREALVQGVRRLSEMFTGVRPMEPGYLSRAGLRRAYICYYLPVNYARVRHVLRELKGFAKLPANPRVLDFGSGPGSASLAAVDELGDARLTLVDVVDEALDDAQFLLDRPFERAQEVPEGGQYDLILAANVLAELPDPAPLRRVLDRALAPGGYLVLVEPATPGPARRVMAWRDELTEAGYKIAAPCLGAARCPMRSHGDLWCHQDAPWDIPRVVSELDRELGFDKESLKYSYLIVTDGGAVRAGPDRWRVVSNLHRSKGKAWAWLCGAKEELAKAELLTRHRIPAFEHARRGDVLEVTPEPKGRLGEGTEVRKL